ncbi:MAG: hypothetical protein ACYC63_17735 [Armatimonadota bacterium]
MVHEDGVGRSGIYLATGQKRTTLDHLKRIYDAAGAGEDLWQDMHPDGCALANNKAHEFFGKYL